MPLTVNGHAILSGVVSIPRTGCWHASLRVDSDREITGRVTIDLDGVSYVGTAIRGGVWRGSAEVKVVAGAAGLARQAQARYYRGAPVRLPLEALLADAGDVLAPSSDAAILGTVLPRWATTAAPVSHGLLALVEAAGASWRSLPDGSVWVGRETWPPVEIDHEVTDEDPAAGWVEIWSERFRLRPGVTFAGKRVSYVEYHVEPTRLRTRYLTE